MLAPRGVFWDFQSGGQSFQHTAQNFMDSMLLRLFCLHSEDVNQLLGIFRIREYKNVFWYDLNWMDSEIQTICSDIDFVLVILISWQERNITQLNTKTLSRFENFSPTHFSLSKLLYQKNSLKTRKFRLSVVENEFRTKLLKKIKTFYKSFLETSLFNINFKYS